MKELNMKNTITLLTITCVLLSVKAADTNSVIKVEVGENAILSFVPMDSRHNEIPGTYSTEDDPVWTITDSGCLTGEPSSFGSNFKITGGTATGTTTVTVRAKVAMLPRGPYNWFTNSVTVTVTAPAISGIKIVKLK